MRSSEGQRLSLDTRLRRLARQISVALEQFEQVEKDGVYESRERLLVFILTGTLLPLPVLPTVYLYALTVVPFPPPTVTLSALTVVPFPPPTVPHPLKRLEAVFSSALRRQTSSPTPVLRSCIEPEN